MKQKIRVVVFSLAALIFACSKSAVERKEGNTMLAFEKAAYFPEPEYHFNTNPLTQEGFELGRKLFYDPLLSYDNNISCGSCHIQTSAFSHHGHSTSHGIFNRLGTRNAPAIMNLAWSKTFMWDGGIFDLDLQPIVPITDRAEMGDTLEHVVARLRKSPVYPALFQRTFGTSEITAANLFKALSQFMVMCISDNAKYDSVQRGQATFTSIEREGYVLYQQRCSTCHVEPLFTDNSFRNNGVRITSIDDKGRYNITLQDADKYKFRVPSLRNLSYTAPFMHNGNIYQLSGVFDHYQYLIQNTPNLDPLFKQNGRIGFQFTNEERAKLTAFLKTLDDKNFVTDRNLAEQ